MVKNLWSAWPSQGVRHEINSVQDTESLESLLEIPLTQIWDSDSIWDFFIDLSKYSVIQNPRISNDTQFFLPRQDSSITGGIQDSNPCWIPLIKWD